MSSPENQRDPRPPMPPFPRLLLRITGAFSLILFLTPTVYVLKYYIADHPRELKHAGLVSTVRLVPGISLDTVAPPLRPLAQSNAAEFYVRAIQSYADRIHSAPDMRSGPAPLPTPHEAAALLQGAHCTDCRFFLSGAEDRPRFFFHDPDQNGAAVPYRLPVSAQEKYRYLSAVVGLAETMANAAKTAPPGDPHRGLLGQVVIRLGDGISREEATYTHVQVALIIKRIGLGLLPADARGLQAYVDDQERYKEAIEAKYALLEVDAPDNLLLQAKIAEHDADPMWRREAVWALGTTLARPGVNWRRPLEALNAKATLAQVANHDTDLTVRAAAGETLGEIAQHGAVIRR